MVYLQLTLRIADVNRDAVAGVYGMCKAPFLDTVAGARSKELLMRDEDVQVLHGFESKEDAHAYLQSRFFTVGIVPSLKPLLAGDPSVRIYEVI